MAKKPFCINLSYIYNPYYSFRAYSNGCNREHPDPKISSSLYKIPGNWAAWHGEIEIKEKPERLAGKSLLRPENHRGTWPIT